MKLNLFILLIAACVLANAEERFAPRLLNYQGFLTDTINNPITNPSVSMTFSIYDASSAGNQKWTEDQSSVGVSRGIFHILLGGVNPIPDSVFKAGADRWLELSIAGLALSPRTRIVSVPYAYSATYSDTSSYARNSAPDNDWVYRVTDGADTTLQMGGRWGLIRFGNTMYGNADSTHVNLGVGSTTGTNGQNYKYITVGGGYGNTASNERTIIGGGYSNSASGYSATVAGGTLNNANNQYTAIGGGGNNLASSYAATVGGGDHNRARGQWSVVSGGGGSNDADSNSAIGDYSAIGGGYRNIARGLTSVIGGGYNNITNNDYDAVGGGYHNVVSNTFGSIAGGYNNTASGYVATVGGGSTNLSSGFISAIGGGSENIASGHCATVSGGSLNAASDSNASVGGGKYNKARGKYSVVSGGGGLNEADSNSAMGDYSSILGGRGNKIAAAGDYSYLFGINSNLTQDSTFMVDMPHVWFGTEANGYEFPKSRGTNGQALVTNGSGQVSWGSIGGDMDWLFLISDVADTTLQTGGRWGIARFGNTMYGNADSTHVNLGIASTTGTNGQNNKYSTVGGGRGNTAGAVNATVGGGYTNTASNNAATVGGGYYNKARGAFSVVSGGGAAVEADSNSAQGDYSSIGGGRHNIASGWISVVGGGDYNIASNSQSTVGGGTGNHAYGVYSTVGGGQSNTASGSNYATVGGGNSNTASGSSDATVAGGAYNTANGDNSTISGGSNNTASGSRATVGGGYNNRANSQSSTAAGGQDNLAGNTYATVAGGGSNTASGNTATVAGGYQNDNAGDYSAILGGLADSITSAGDYSYLFGINSNLTQDSTFMVDMPHVRFGKESGGYEFPTADGTNGQTLITNGSGRLSWGTPQVAVLTISGNNISSAVSGNFGVGESAPTSKLDVAGQNGYEQFRMRQTYTPSGSADPNGKLGDVAWDESYVYVKTEAGWKRSTLSSW